MKRISNIEMAAYAQYSNLDGAMLIPILFVINNNNSIIIIRSYGRSTETCVCAPEVRYVFSEYSSMFRPHINKLARVLYCIYKIGCGMASVPVRAELRAK